MLDFVGTLQPAGTVTPGGFEDDVAAGAAEGVPDGLTELELVLDAGFDDEEVDASEVDELIEVGELVFGELAVELGVGAGEEETQPRS